MDDSTDSSSLENAETRARYDESVDVRLALRRLAVVCLRSILRRIEPPAAWVGYRDRDGVLHPFPSESDSVDETE